MKTICWLLLATVMCGSAVAEDPPFFDSRNDDIPETDTLPKWNMPFNISILEYVAMKVSAEANAVSTEKEIYKCQCFDDVGFTIYVHKILKTGDPPVKRPLSNEKWLKHLTAQFFEVAVKRMVDRGQDIPDELAEWHRAIKDKRLDEETLPFNIRVEYRESKLEESVVLTEQYDYLVLRRKLFKDIERWQNGENVSFEEGFKELMKEADKKGMMR